MRSGKFRGADSGAQLRPGSYCKVCDRMRRKISTSRAAHIETSPNRSWASMQNARLRSGRSHQKDMICWLLHFAASDGRASGLASSHRRMPSRQKKPVTRRGRVRACTALPISNAPSLPIWLLPTLNCSSVVLVRRAFAISPAPCAQRFVKQRPRRMSEVLVESTSESRVAPCAHM
jgi:hypothetical protein